MKHETISVRLPAMLLCASRAMARGAGVSLNRWIILRLADLFPAQDRETLLWGRDEAAELKEEEKS